MKNSKSALETRVAAQLLFELEMCAGDSATQGAALEAFMAVAFPPRKPVVTAAGFYSFASMVVSVLAPVASLAGIMFAGFAL